MYTKWTWLTSFYEPCDNIRLIASKGRIRRQHWSRRLKKRKTFTNAHVHLKNANLFKHSNTSEKQQLRNPHAQRNGQKAFVVPQKHSKKTTRQRNIVKKKKKKQVLL